MNNRFSNSLLILAVGGIMAAGSVSAQPHYYFGAGRALSIRPSRVNQ